MEKSGSAKQKREKELQYPEVSLHDQGRTSELGHLEGKLALVWGGNGLWESCWREATLGENENVSTAELLTSSDERTKPKGRELNHM